MNRFLFKVASGASCLAGLVMACGDDDDGAPPVTLLDGGKDTSASPSLDADTKADSAVAPSDAGTDADDAAAEPEAGIAIAAPTFTPPPGAYVPPQCVAISAVEGVIHYTLDGSAPSASSAIYSGPVAVNDQTQPTTISAISITDAGSSAVSKGTYSVAIEGPKSAPVAYDPFSGSYDGGVVVKLASVSPGAVICYQLDGGLPTCKSNADAPVICPGDGGQPPIPLPTCTLGITYDGGGVALGGDAGSTVVVKAIACPPYSVASDLTQATYSF